jgi:hypothetical protein
MINGLTTVVGGTLSTIPQDTAILGLYFMTTKGNPFTDPNIKIQAAAYRMLAILGVVIGGIWTYSILIVPLKATLKVALAVGILVLSIDGFRMIQNVLGHHNLTQRAQQLGLYGFFKSFNSCSREEAEALTRRTLLRSQWIPLYLHGGAVTVEEVD